MGYANAMPKLLAHAIIILDLIPHSSMRDFLTAAMFAAVCKAGNFPTPSNTKSSCSLLSMKWQVTANKNPYGSMSKYLKLRSQL